MFKTLARLFPRGFAWTRPNGGPFDALVKALSNTGENFKIFADTVWLRIFPDTTDALAQFEDQFGLFVDPALSEEERRQRVAARWAALGGQSPSYIRDTLVAAGFPQLFVHEWWEPDSDPVITRSPLIPSGGAIPLSGEVELEGGGSLLLQSGQPLLLQQIPLASTPTQFGAAQFGAAQFGGTSIEELVPRGQVLVNNRLNDPAYPVREFVEPSSGPSFGAAQFGAAQFGGLGGDPQDVRPYYLYIGGETFGEVAGVPASRRRELLSILLKIAPAHLWLILIVEFD